jgi:hypothetical protein
MTDIVAEVKSGLAAEWEARLARLRERRAQAEREGDAEWLAEIYLSVADAEKYVAALKAEAGRPSRLARASSPTSSRSCG